VTSSPVPLDHEEDTFWRTLVDIVTRLPQALDENFGRETGLTMPGYAVLVALSEAPDRQLRMGDLATTTGLSRSRVTRLVDDLARRSLVQRRKSDSDGRSAFAVITDLGAATLERAYPGHVTRVRALVLDHLTRAELRSMTDGLHRISQALRESDE
jgi:DNA-binding MarR family transcriptional regulator